MKKSIILVSIFFIIVLFFGTILGLAADTENSGEPLVVVVHGVGGGNRPIGWSKDVEKEWNIGDVQEVTFRQEGRDDSFATSYMDFSKNGGDWALSVQKQLKNIIDKNPDRPIVIISHSWGSVATSMALSGGVGGGTSKGLEERDYNIPAIDLGKARIKEWVTIGSPLGRANATNVAGNLRQLNIQVSNNKPNTVDHWTNMYDPEDPVSMQSHNLADAENIEVRGSAGWFMNRITGGVAAHTGIWTNPRVTKHMRDTVKHLSEEEEGEKPVPKPVPASKPAVAQTPKPAQSIPVPKPATTSPALTSAPAKPATAPSIPTRSSAPAPAKVTFIVTVVDENGAAIPNSSIQISGPAVGNATNAGGSFSINGFPEGSYTIKASAKGYVSVEVAAVFKSGMGAISIRLKKETPQPTGKINFAVVVVDKEGHPVPNANIQLSGPASGGGVAPAGQLNFTGFPEGTYAIKIQAKGYKAEQMPLTVEADMGAEIGGQTGVTILLEKETPPKQPAPIQAAGVPSPSDEFVGTWQGESRIIRDDGPKPHVGKVTPVTLKIAVLGNVYVIYIGEDMLGESKDSKTEVKREGNTLVYNWCGPFIFTAACITFKFNSVNQDTINGEQKFTLYGTENRSSSVVSSLNLKRISG